jgi:hypothetical protein
MQMSIDFKNQYIDERNAFYDANPRIPRKNPEGTAKPLLRLRRYAIRSYHERHGHFWVLNIHVPKPGPKKPARRLRRDVDRDGIAGCRAGSSGPAAAGSARLPRPRFTESYTANF